MLTASDAAISGHYSRASGPAGISLTSPQIAQIGKYVGTCLAAGGATVKDIILTIGSVTAPADLDRYADHPARASVGEERHGEPAPTVEPGLSAGGRGARGYQVSTALVMKRET
jgi:hypothetical protein